MMFAKPEKAIKDEGHLSRMRQLPCLVCGKYGPSECHHLKRGVGRSMSQKAGDNFVVPLCSECHRGPKGVELAGDETKFFATHEIYSAKGYAELFYQHSKDYDVCEYLIMRRFL